MKLPPFALLWPVLANDILFPGLAAAAVLLLTWLILGRGAGVVGGCIALATAVGLGYWLSGAIPFQPERLGWQWLFWATAAALLVGLLTRLPDWPGRLGWVVPATTTLAGCFLVSSADQKLGPWTVALFAIVAAGEWCIGEEAARRELGGVVPIYLAAVFLAGAAVLVMGSHRFFDAAMIGTGSLTAIAIVAWFLRLDVGSIVPGSVIALCGLMLAGLSETYSNVPTACFFLVALAPLLLSVSLWPPLARLRPVFRHAIQTAVLLVPLVAAVVLTFRYDSLPF